MKSGSAILMVVLFLSIATLYMFSLLDSSGQLLETSKLRQQTIKNHYAAEGTARVAIELLKEDNLNLDKKEYLMGSAVLIKKDRKAFAVQVERSGFNTKFFVDSKSYKILKYEHL